MKENVVSYWDQRKEKLKEKYPVIHDEDLKYVDGKENIMLEILSYKLGKTKEELVEIIVSL